MFQLCLSDRAIKHDKYGLYGRRYAQNPSNKSLVDR